jgi:hypothetical protein
MKPLIRLIITGLVYLSVSSCHPEEDIKQVENSDIISFLSTPPTNLTANGKDSYEIVVQLPPTAIEAYKTVTFSASKGKFVGEKNPLESRVRIEPNGKASVTWIVPDEEGDCFINASIGPEDKTYKATQQTVKVGPIARNLAIDIDDADLSVKGLTRTTVAAGSKTIVVFKASINPNVPESLKTLNFKCSKGKFDGEGGEKARSLKVKADGTITIKWIAADEAGASYVSVSAGSAELDKQEAVINLIEARPSFRLVAPTGDMIANGVSVLTYEITNALNIPASKLVIAKNRGTLIDAAGNLMKDGSLQLSSNGRNLFYLQLDQNVEPYYLKVQTESGSFSEAHNFTPTRAYADEIFVAPIKLSIAKDDKDLTINVMLRRDTGKGKVSTGTEVKFEAYQLKPDKTKADVGGLFDKAPVVFSNADETVSVKYLIDRTKLLPGKPLLFHVTSPDAKTPTDIAVNIE